MLSLLRVKRHRYVTFVVSMAIFIVVIVYFYDYDRNVRRTTHVRISKSKENMVEKKILFWNKLFDVEELYSTFGNGDHCEDHTRPCWVTHDRNVRVEDFDAVLIYAKGIRNIDDFPKIRKQSQKYVYVNAESAGNEIIEYEEMRKDFFNLTMTYRLDSDVFLPYGNVRDLRNKIIVAPALNPEWKTYDDVDGATGPRTNVWKKTKSAVWFVSHCETNSKRENYVVELLRHIDVAIIGQCGKKWVCTRNRNCFREIVEPNYYFYLSFENSLCNDYVTEKLYNALRHDVVPVVYGGANYTRFAPPGSYINALDFDSPELLANYLKSLIQRPDEYERFFDWKRHYEIVVSYGRITCELCRYLHDDVTTQSYSRLDLWWSTDQCPLQDKLMYLPYLTKQNSNDFNRRDNNMFDF